MPSVDLSTKVLPRKRFIRYLALIFRGPRLFIILCKCGFYRCLRGKKFIDFVVHHIRNLFGQGIKNASHDQQKYLLFEGTSVLVQHLRL